MPVSEGPTDRLPRSRALCGDSSVLTCVAMVWLLLSGLLLLATGVALYDGYPDSGPSWSVVVTSALTTVSLLGLSGTGVFVAWRRKRVLGTVGFLALLLVSASLSVFLVEMGVADARGLLSRSTVATVADTQCAGGLESRQCREGR